MSSIRSLIPSSIRRPIMKLNGFIDSNPKLALPGIMRRMVRASIGSRMKIPKTMIPSLHWRPSFDASLYLYCRRAHDEQRSCGGMQHLIGNTAHRPAPNAVVAVGGHDDQINVRPRRLADNLLCDIANGCNRCNMGLIGRAELSSQGGQLL